VGAGEVERPALEAPAQHLEELAGAGVALVVVQEVPVRPLLGRVAAGHDVDP
jgi:hypothetical protein